MLHTHEKIESDWGSLSWITNNKYSSNFIYETYLNIVSFSEQKQSWNNLGIYELEKANLNSSTIEELLSYRTCRNH